MNLAQLWKLPVLYVCENNLYNEYTHYSETTAGDVQARAIAFGLPAEAVDGQDVRAVHAAASRMVARARRGEGPAFLLANTYRFRGHHVGDISRDYYRSKQEEQRWMSERDPLPLYAGWLTSEGLADQAMLERIQSEVAAEMDAAVEFAQNAPFPDPRRVDEDVYA
jgi:pyruvate dehydrogenase E1 component alpha subunit